MGAPSPDQARRLWHLLETLNAVTYFSPECRDAPAEAGLDGFWMGYFACRAAPLGPVGAGVVEATFANFHPGRIGRAIPEAWRRVEPEALAGIRADAAARALRRILGDGAAEMLAADVTSSLAAAVAAGDPLGRPLFAANRELAPPSDPVAGLWTLATTLREHRGDAHVALLAGEGLDGCECHVVFAAATGAPPADLQQSRGWSADDWAAAVDRLRARGWLDAGGALTADGRARRDRIETATDDLAGRPYAAVPDVDALVARLTPAAATVARAGDIRYPNPMGLPSVADPA